MMSIVQKATPKHILIGVLGLILLGLIFGALTGDTSKKSKCTAQKRAAQEAKANQAVVVEEIDAIPVESVEITAEPEEKTVKETVAEGLEDTKEAVAEGVETVKEKAVAAKETVAEGLEDAKEAVADGVETVKEKAVDAKEAVAEGLEDTKEAVADGAETVKEKAVDAKEAIAEGFEDTKEAATDGAETVKEKAVDAKEAVAEGLEDTKEAAAEGVETAKEEAVDAKETVAQELGGAEGEEVSEEDVAKTTNKLIESEEEGTPEVQTIDVVLNLKDTDGNDLGQQAVKLDVKSDESTVTATADATEEDAETEDKPSLDVSNIEAMIQKMETDLDALKAELKALKESK